MNTKKHSRQKYHALILATAILTLNFWAWSLLSPLATTYKEIFQLSPVAVSFLIATPVLIGALGRIPVGLLTDRYGGRAVFFWICLLTAMSVAGLAFTSDPNILFLLAGAIGVAGASFVAGVPFISAWFPKKQRGFALGVYALGNGGTAVSGLLTPWSAEALGRQNMFLAVALILFVAGIAMWRLSREGPEWQRAKGGNLKRLWSALKWEFTWKLSLIYGLTFGAFVALGLYLPVHLNQSYGLDPADAAARAAGFELLATLVRPVGGWLSDRFSGLSVIKAVCMAIFVLAALAAVGPDLMPFGTLAYLGLAMVLGIGNGAVFAIVGHQCPPAIVGTVTGLVGAAGVIGGYFPPILMGVSFQLFGSITFAVGLLSVVSLVLFFTLKRLFGTNFRYVNR